MLLSRATGSVSSGNLSAFDVIGSKAREIVGDATGDARLLTLLQMETRQVARDNIEILRLNRRHQTSVVPYSTDNRGKTKTKVITLANHKGHSQYGEPIKTRSSST